VEAWGVLGGDTRNGVRRAWKGAEKVNKDSGKRRIGETVNVLLPQDTPRSLLGHGLVLVWELQGKLIDSDLVRAYKRLTFTWDLESAITREGQWI